jgi:prepilin-type N-terminal cleavage/methylation domain-containing protein
MNPFQKKAFDNKGFTLIEVIAVLIILGIIGVVAASRVGSNSNDVIPQRDILKSHIRYAQLKALGDDKNTWSITFNNANSYTLNCTPGTASTCPPTTNLPSEDGSGHDFSKYGISVAVADANPASKIIFDHWGSLINEAATPAPLAAEFIKITLDQSGDKKAFRVYTNTGHIEDTTP